MHLKLQLILKNYFRLFGSEEGKGFKGLKSGESKCMSYFAELKRSEAS